MQISRRNFLFASFGSLVGLWGIQKIFRRNYKIKGNLLGASHQRGHLLRNKNFAEPDQAEKKSIVIVGGGMAGLSAAWKLKKSGIDDFIILELEDEVGGNSAFGANSVSAYPWGAHYVPLPGPEALAVREMFEDLQIIQGYQSNGVPKYNELYICAAPDERLFIAGQWQEGLVPKVGVPSSEKDQYVSFFKQMNDFKNAKGKDGRRGFVIPIDHCSTDSRFLALDTITMEQYMDQNKWTSPSLRWYVNYCCRDDYGSDMKHVSAWAGIHYFASRDGISDDGDDHEVLTWPEGNGWIVKELKKQLQNRIQSKSMAYKIRNENQKVFVDYYDFQNDKTKRIECNHLIYCAPKFTAPFIIENYPKNTTPSLSYAPWVVANLTLNNLPEDIGAPLSWDNVIFNGPSLGYVDATHQSTSRFRHSTVITYYNPLSGSDPAQERKAALERTYDQWTQMIIPHLEYAHSEIRKIIESCDVWLWGHAMARPLPNLIWSDRKKWIKSLDRIHFAHSDMSGISIFEEAQFHGVSAAQTIMKDLNHKFTSSL